MSFLRGQSLFRGSFTFNECNWGQIISSLYRGKLFYRGTTIRGSPIFTFTIKIIVFYFQVQLLSSTLTSERVQGPYYSAMYVVLELKVDS